MLRIAHQVEFVDFVAARSRKKHGILVVHPTGAGKTISGILTLINFSNLQWTILAPTQSILLQWKRDISKIVQNAPREAINRAEHTAYMTYDEILSTPTLMDDHLTKQSIVICDEAHNLFMLPARHGTALVGSLTNKLQQEVKKVILLSASPFHTNTAQILDLCEVAAGRELVKNRITELRVRKSVFKNLFVGWILPEAVNVNRNTTLLLFCGLMLSVFNQPLYNKISSLIASLVGRGFAGMFYALPTNHQKAAIKFMTELITELGPDGVTAIVSASFQMLLCSTMMFHQFVLRPWAETHSLEVRKLDIQKVMHLCSPYIDIPDPRSLEDFPDTTIFRETYVLESSVMDMLNKFIYGLASAEDFLSRGMVSNLNEGKRILVDTPEDYIVWGSITSYFPTETKISAKVRKALGIMQKTNFKRIVVYSRFSIGLEKIQAALDTLFPTVKVYKSTPSIGVPKDALETYDIVLLHPDLYEGVDIAGCWTFVIMDPPEHMVQNHQLLGRTRRITSHIMFSKKEEKYCHYYYIIGELVDKNAFGKDPFFRKSARKVMRYFRNLFTQTKYWGEEFSLDVSFGYFVKKIQNLGALPEQLAYHKSASQLEQFSKLMNEISQHSTKRTANKNRACNPWFPYPDPKTEGIPDCTDITT